jgi:TRAP-type C4-dicarboxylate transport system permease large subunit
VKLALVNNRNQENEIKKVSNTPHSLIVTEISELRPVLPTTKTCQTTCFILWILVAASAFGYVLSYKQLPQQMTAWALSLHVQF